MPSSITVVRAFVASPSDLAEEREILAGEIESLNVGWMKINKIMMQVVRWETHTYPAVGDSPQAVINAQIGDSYDIFIGLMGAKFGTSTTQFGSGTEEEFERAYRKWQADQNSTQIMFYFKSMNVDSMSVDLQQLLKVREFKNRIAQAGVYYSTFANREQFSQQLRLHLTQVIQHWLSPSSVQLQMAPHSQPISNELPPAVESLELGFLDYLDLGLQAFKAATEAMERIGAANQEVAAAMQRRAEQMEALKSSQLTFDAAAANKIVLLSAQDMSLFASRIDAEIPIFAQAYKDAMSNVTRLASLSIEDFTPDFNQLRNLRDIIVEHEPQVNEAMEKLTALRDTISRLPRVSGVFNQAKSKTTRSLNALWTEFDFTRKLNRDAVNLLNTLLDKENDSQRPSGANSP